MGATCAVGRHRSTSQSTPAPPCSHRQSMAWPSISRAMKPQALGSSRRQARSTAPPCAERKSAGTQPCSSPTNLTRCSGGASSSALCTARLPVSSPAEASSRTTPSSCPTAPRRSASPRAPCSRSRSSDRQALSARALFSAVKRLCSFQDSTSTTSASAPSQKRTLRARPGGVPAQPPPRSEDASESLAPSAARPSGGVPARLLPHSVDASDPRRSFCGCSASRSSRASSSSAQESVASPAAPDSGRRHGRRAAARESSQHRDILCPAGRGRKGREN
mmetsp:Transcript_69967/g.182346  ORF Transcript_69967/g.182346 Transcript_69967/m.182346 type:complete len:277 (-) Transcript_69967:62-892(-)